MLRKVCRSTAIAIVSFSYDHCSFNDYTDYTDYNDDYQHIQYKVTKKYSY